MYNTKKTSIKKSIAVFLAITFCVICFDRTVVFASVPNYCSNCGAKLEGLSTLEIGRKNIMYLLDIIMMENQL